jgi:hypothetical protein
MEFHDLGTEAFTRALLDAVDWCNRPRNALPVPLRSELLRPGSNDLAEAVVELTSLRCELLETHHPVVDAMSGRLLAYFPDAELRDPAAATRSNGFFDERQIPPWETWVAMVSIPDAQPSRRRCLLSWVPRALVGQAAEASVVHPSYASAGSIACCSMSRARCCARLVATEITTRSGVRFDCRVEACMRSGTLR